MTVELLVLETTALEGKIINLLLRLALVPGLELQALSVRLP